MIRVGFTKIGGQGWQGGHNYLTNLLQFIIEYQSEELTPVLFADPLSDEKEMSDYSSIEGLEIVYSKAFSERRKSASLLNAITFGRDKKIKEAFQKKGIDVVFEVARYFGRNIGIPAVAWIPDLQHRDLPHFFGPIAHWRRDLGFRLQIASGRKIMLSSFDAKYACERYYRTKKGQTEVVSFAVPSAAADNPVTRPALERIYGLTTPFFFMPNQFWKHKNHRLVVDALELLRAQGVNDVVVVATGNPGDARDKGYFRQLENEIDIRNLKSNFRILGFVPYHHVRALLRASRALLNPSLYEGWSTTVEEAKSIGAPMILSDLPVHKEQATSNVIFFDRYSAPSLANALNTFSISISKNDYTLIENTRIRVQQFSEKFKDLVNNAASAAYR